MHAKPMVFTGEIPAG